MRINTEPKLLWSLEPALVSVKKLENVALNLMD